MKINEVTHPSDKALFEALDIENDTDLKTQDLVKIIKSINGPWSKPMTAEESMKFIDDMVKSNG